VRVSLPPRTAHSRGLNSSTGP